MLKARASQAPVAELAASTPVAPGQELHPGRGCGGTSLCSFSRVMARGQATLPGRTGRSREYRNINVCIIWVGFQTSFPSEDALNRGRKNPALLDILGPRGHSLPPHPPVPRATTVAWGPPASAAAHVTEPHDPGKFRQSPAHQHDHPGAGTQGGDRSPATPSNHRLLDKDHRFLFGFYLEANENVANLFISPSTSQSELNRYLSTTDTAAGMADGPVTAPAPGAPFVRWGPGTLHSPSALVTEVTASKGSSVSCFCPRGQQSSPKRKGF